jgi:hypothetical protein
MKKTILALYGAAVAVIVSILYHYVSVTMGWPRDASFLAAICVGILLLLFYDLLMSSKVIRRRLSVLAQVEGAWAITVSESQDRPTSVCKIYLNSNGSYVYRGFALTPDGVIAAEWISRDVAFDENKEEMSFTADGVVIADSKRLRNYGYIKFIKNTKGKYDYGSGYFVDVDEDVVERRMTLTRITSAEFDQSLTRPSEGDATAGEKTDGKADAKAGAKPETKPAEKLSPKAAEKATEKVAAKAA